MHEFASKQDGEPISIRLAATQAPVFLSTPQAK